jgi:ribose transport system permease protein
MTDLQASTGERKRKKFTISNTIILFIILILMVLFFSLTSEFFFSLLNLIPMLNNLSFIGVTAAVLDDGLITGEIDFSIGGNIGLTSCLAALLLSYGLNGYLVVLICLMRRRSHRGL